MATLRDLPRGIGKRSYPHGGEAIGFENHFSKNLFKRNGNMESPDISRLINLRSMSLLTTRRVYPVVALPHASDEPGCCQGVVTHQLLSRKTIRRSFFSYDGAYPEITG